MIVIFYSLRQIPPHYSAQRKKPVRKEDRNSDQIEEINKNIQSTTPKERKKNAEKETSRVRFYTSLLSLSLLVSRLSIHLNLQIYITTPLLSPRFIHQYLSIFFYFVRNPVPFAQRQLCYLCEALWEGRGHEHSPTVINVHP
jgi:hypothetical protein